MTSFKKLVIALGVGSIMSAASASTVNPGLTTEEIQDLLEQHMSTDVAMHCSSTFHNKMGRPVFKDEWKQMFSGIMNGTASFSERSSLGCNIGPVG